MHLLGLRRKHRRPASVAAGRAVKAFEHLEASCIGALDAILRATKATLPFVEEQLRRMRELMGQDFWSCTASPPNRHGLETFLRHHHRQGMSPRRLSVEELFHPATLETFKV